MLLAGTDPKISKKIRQWDLRPDIRMKVTKMEDISIPCHSSFQRDSFRIYTQNIKFNVCIAVIDLFFIYETMHHSKGFICK